MARSNFIPIQRVIALDRNVRSKIYFNNRAERFPLTFVAYN